MGARFDRSGRRAFLRALAAAGLSAQARAAGIGAASFDHIECWTTSAPASAAFLARIFGNNVLENRQTERRYVRLGESFLAADQGQAVRVDHFCAGIPGFQVANAHGYLTMRGIGYRDYPSGRDTAVTDPSGMRLQLAGDRGWDQLLTGTAAPEALAIPAPPIFEVLRIESLLLRAASLTASAEFYGQLFEGAAGADSERWFTVGVSRLGLRQATAGEPSAVDHIRLAVKRFDAAGAQAALGEAGARQIRRIGPDELEFADGDGYRFRVAAL